MVAVLGEGLTAAVFFTAFMVVLFLGTRCLPGRWAEGAPLADGSRERYRLNGMLLFSLCVLAVLVTALVRPTALAYPVRHWQALFVAANVFSLIAAVWLWADGRQRRGPGARSAAVDCFLGVRLNPKLAGVDLKMFAYRPSLIGLFLFNVSCAAAQGLEQGSLSQRMILYQVMFFVYIANFFQFEEGMLFTWDVMSERFGWMLVWGDLVLVPFFYSLPGHVLIDVSAPLGAGQALLSTSAFLLGFWVFRGANAQKHRFRRSGATHIWGRPAQTLEGRLLVSGFWGIGRKLNYTGEFLVYAAWTSLCGASSMLPYLVLLWLSALFVHRARRDDRRCRAKYGELWDRYCRKVRYRLVPFVY
ncbi:hypothetical protein [Streptomyces curacoi]|uniref:Delta(14)-sterol reductase n=1 Tax=Streptomyces curacoi TaxID=146536 RepID=A0A117P5H0_9ACTN|nr:hypothetical protein [Streptomyces curacoi]KUM73432.1 hypothetical protein AQI70_21955 [Streptomyces curacoi]